MFGRDLRLSRLFVMFVGKCEQSNIIRPLAKAVQCERRYRLTDRACSPSASLRTGSGNPLILPLCRSHVSRKGVQGTAFMVHWHKVGFFFLSPVCVGRNRKLALLTLEVLGGPPSGSNSVWWLTLCWCRGGPLQVHFEWSWPS